MDGRRLFENSQPQPVRRRAGLGRFVRGDFADLPRVDSNGTIMHARMDIDKSLMHNLISRAGDYVQN